MFLFAGRIFVFCGLSWRMETTTFSLALELPELNVPQYGHKPLGQYIYIEIFELLILS